MRTPGTKFEELVVWQKAHLFVLQAVRGLFAGPSGFCLLNSDS